MNEKNGASIRGPVQGIMRYWPLILFGIMLIGGAFLLNYRVQAIEVSDRRQMEAIEELRKEQYALKYSIMEKLKDIEAQVRVIEERTRK